MINPSAIMPHRCWRLLASAATIALVATPASQALAQQAPAAAAQDAPVQVADAAATGGGVEDIIVTARKRREKLQEVPIAISALSSAQLQRRDVQSVMDLLLVVPNFQAPKNTVSFSAPQFYLRGAGRANNNWNAENAVAVFVDDIYLQSTAAAYIDQIDFERVEVLRGPQGRFTVATRRSVRSSSFRAGPPRRTSMPPSMPLPAATIAAISRATSRSR